MSMFVSMLTLTDFAPLVSTSADWVFRTSQKVWWFDSLADFLSDSVVPWHKNEITGLIIIF